MRKRLAVVIAALMILSGLALTAFAEEELFDTKTAASQMEKGVKLLGSKNYDGAIAAFEEAVAAAPSAEAHYLLGYAYYMKGKAGDEDSRQMAIENFDQAYELDPNFTPNKVLPGEPAPEQKADMSDDVTPAAAAPASKLEPGAATSQEQPKP